MTTGVKDTTAAVQERVKEMADLLEPHDFKTGSRGFLLQSRETVAGKKYMFNIQVIEVGSKNQ